MALYTGIRAYALNKTEPESIWFIARDYNLANIFKDLFESEELYFTKVVEANTLKEKLATIKHQYLDMEHVINKINEIQDNCTFEVHVS